MSNNIFRLELTPKEKLLTAIEKQLERIYPNTLETNTLFFAFTGAKDIVIYRANVLNKMVKGLTTKHLTGLLSSTKKASVWS
jgi:hypothetical protein